MARKKKKHQEAPGALSDSSDDAQKGVPECLHGTRALDLGNLKKVLRNGLPTHCQACANGPKTTSGLLKGSLDTSDPPYPAFMAPSTEHQHHAVAGPEVAEVSLPVSDKHLETCHPVPSVNGANPCPINYEECVKTSSFLGEVGDPTLCCEHLNGNDSQTAKSSHFDNGDSVVFDQELVMTESVSQNTGGLGAVMSVMKDENEASASGDPSGEVTTSGTQAVTSCEPTCSKQDSSVTSNVSECEKDLMPVMKGFVLRDKIAEAGDVPPDRLSSDVSLRGSAVVDTAPVADIAAQENGDGDASHATPDPPVPSGAPSQGVPEANPLVQAVSEASRFLCLRCGHLGCGSHALQHFLTPHSDPHCLALEVDVWRLWCYKCNGAVEISRRSAQVVQFVQKRASDNNARNNVSKALTKGAILVPACNDKQSTVRESTTTEEAAVVATKGASKGKAKEVQKCGKREDGEDDNKRVKGLANLGNTCFFNSVMQNLGQTPYLEDLLQARCKAGLRCRFKPAEGTTDLEPLEVDLPPARPLTQALLGFLQEMRCGMPRPRPVHTQLCQVAPQFRGNQQHDSHELLRHLVEGVCNEEAKRQKQAVLASFGLSTKVKPSEVDESTKNKIQAYKESVSQTVLDEVFGGSLLTTVVCQECGHVTQREEPFKDLSLSIPDDKPMRLVKKVPEETKGKKCAKQQRKDRRDRRGRKNSEPQQEMEEVACDSCTLSGGGSIEIAADDEADDEDADNVAEPAAKATPAIGTKTLAPRPPQPQDGTLLACLHQFTSPELLIGANALSCDGCGNGKRSAASLQLLVREPPRVLTLHLKRFQQSGRALSKVNRHVPFPLVLDLAPYCSPQQKPDERSCIEYSLYGIVEHSGRLSGGHYTAYVKARSNGRWFHASDSHVTEVTEATVLKSQAYLLFYERLR